MASCQRVMVVHNSYQQHGGEDMVFNAEVNMLRERGHDVATYSRDNRSIEDLSKVKLALDTVWSTQTVKDINQFIKEFKPDVIHVHNTFPLISPSLYWIAARNHVPVVQTLHNYRLLCPQAMFLRDSRICEDCLGKSLWRSVTHRCYRNSVMQTVVLAGMMEGHRKIGTFQNKVTRYIALNRFSKEKFIQGGLPSERISVKPNFIDIPKKSSASRSGALFVGRVSVEKGTSLLVEMLDRLPDMTLDAIGAGPEFATLQSHPRVHAFGSMNHDEIIERMRRAAYLIMPSIWYETFALVIMEAFACGLPVIAPAFGSMKEMIEDEKTGVLFEPNSVDSLIEKIHWANQHPEEMTHIGSNARDEYDNKYTSSKNYEQLIAIYEAAMAEKRGTLC